MSELLKSETESLILWKKQVASHLSAARPLLILPHLTNTTSLFRTSNALRHSLLNIQACLTRVIALENTFSPALISPRRLSCPFCLDSSSTSGYLHPFRWSAPTRRRRCWGREIERYCACFGRREIPPQQRPLGAPIKAFINEHGGSERAWVTRSDKRVMLLSQRWQDFLLGADFSRKAINPRWRWYINESGMCGWLQNKQEVGIWFGWNLERSRRVLKTYTKGTLGDLFEKVGLKNCC